jgi:rubrerythrin
MRMSKLLLLACAIAWKWKCLMCGITMETEGQPPKCPNCGRGMTAI